MYQIRHCDILDNLYGIGLGYTEFKLSCTVLVDFRSYSEKVEDFQINSKFQNHSRKSKMIHTGTSEIFIATGMSEKSPKMFSILHMEKVPQFQFILIK